MGIKKGASFTAITEVSRILTQIRARWPAVRILLRADAGFARDELMTWCESNGVDFLFGLAHNRRLVGATEGEFAAAQEQSQKTGKPARRSKDFTWRTRNSREEHEARHRYEKNYCARGEMENCIKEMPA